MPDLEIDKGNLGCLRACLGRAHEAALKLEEASRTDATLTGRNFELVRDLQHEIAVIGRRLNGLLQEAPRLTLQSTQAQDLEESTDTDLAIVPFPGSGVNFRTVGSFGGGDAA